MSENLQAINESPMMRQRDEAGVAKRYVALAAAGAIILVGGGYQFLNEGDDSAAALREAGMTNGNDCDDLEFDNAAADSNKYFSDAFLPKNTVASKGEVQEY